jgi:acetyltransferase-like isoleucine patch superfamily enzyme
MIKKIIIKILRVLKLKQKIDRMMVLIDSADSNISKCGDSFSPGIGTRIENGQYMEIGHDVSLGRRSHLVAIHSWRHKAGTQLLRPRLKIGNNVKVTGSLQLHCSASIEIGDSVLIASNVLYATVRTVILKSMKVLI